MVFYQVFLNCRNCLQIKISQSTAIKVTVNSKEESSKDFCLDFVQEFGLKSTQKCQLD